MFEQNLPADVSTELMREFENVEGVYQLPHFYQDNVQLTTREKLDLDVYIDQLKSKKRF